MEDYELTLFDRLNMIRDTINKYGKVNCEEVARIYSYVEERFATTECKEVYRPIRTQDGKTKVRGFCGACHHRLPFNPKYEYCPYCGNRLIKTKGEKK